MVPPGAFRVPVCDQANAESGFLTYSSSPARAGAADAERYCANEREERSTDDSICTALYRHNRNS